MRSRNSTYLSEEYIFIVSLFCHVIVMLLFYKGVPVLFKKIEDTPPQIIAFEMLPVKEVANVKDQKQVEQKEVPSKQEEAKKIKNTKTSKQEKVLPKTEKIDDKKSQDTKVIAKKTNDLATKKHIEQATEKQNAPKKSKSNKKNQKSKINEEDIIDSLLKNLEDASAGKTAKSSKRKLEKAKDNGKFAKGAAYDENSPLSITEHMLIKQQIEKHWRPPIGAKDLDKAKVKIHVSVDPDGTIKEVDIQGYECPIGSESTCQLLSESAVRAIRTTGKLKDLIKDRYEFWKEITLLFEPNEIAG